MRSLFIFVLLIIACEIKTDDHVCENHKVSSDIRECLGKSTGYPHYTCCGIHIKTENGTTNLTCAPLPNTKSAKSLSKEVLEKEAIHYNATLVDFQCPEQEDTIQGTCEEFLSVMVNDHNECLKLTETDKNKTCCGLKLTQKYNDQGDKISANLCFGLPIDKNQREGYLKRLKEEAEGEGGSIYDYKCKSEYYFKNLFINIVISLMLLLL